MARRIFITVGEASGDQHAALLIRELRLLDKDVVVEGIGGPQMAKAGALVHYDTVQRAAMGPRSLLRFFEIHRIFKWMREHFRSHRPDLLICIDSWAMNWHFARLAHDTGIPVLYYIAPQIWASRPGRMKRLRRYVDRVACILPFEEKFFRDHQVEATFVGHPLFDELPSHPGDDLLNRFPNRPPVIGVIPGSRLNVARANFNPLLQVCDKILEVFPDAKFLIPTMPATDIFVRRTLEMKYPNSSQTAPAEGGINTIGPFSLGLNQFNELVPRCDLCLAVSGTATLHAAGHGIPQIVVFRLSPIYWHLFVRWVVKTRTYSLVNLLNDSRQEIVPEYIPWYGSIQPVASKALQYLRDPQLLAQQRDRMRNMIRGLNRPGASRNAANLAIDLIVGRAATV